MANNLILDDNGIFVKGLRQSVSFPSEGHNDLIELENNSFWLKHRNNIITNIIRRFPYSGDFIDIGGGNGYQLNEIAKTINNGKNILIEPGYQGCLAARKRGVELVYNSTFQDFNFEEYKVGGVALFDVLEHIEDDQNFLVDILSKLDIGARIYLTLPAHNHLWSDVDPFGGHYRRYNLNMINQLSNNLEVELEYFTYFFSYLYPISFLLRALPYKLGVRKSDKEIRETEKSQHNPRGLIKRLFNFFEKLELNKITDSKIEIGASCLVVLKKV